MSRPEPTEYAAFYETYISQVPETDILPAITTQGHEFLQFLRSIPESAGSVRHAPYTWSVKEVLGHLIDCERIFAYRLLRFARNDQTPLAGFDENSYVPAGHFDEVPLTDLVSEWEAVRAATQALLQNLPAEAWARSGDANGNLVSVRALVFILVGHVRHHGAILRKRLTGA